MGLVFPWNDWDEVFSCPTKDYHYRGEFGILVWTISILQHGFSKFFHIDFAVWSGIACYHSLAGFDTNFCSAVGVRECNG